MTPSQGRVSQVAEALRRRCAGGRESAVLDGPRCFGGQTRTTCALSRSTPGVADPLRLKSLDVTVRTRLPNEPELDFRLAAPSMCRRCALNIRSSCSIVSGLPAKNSNPARVAMQCTNRGRPSAVSKSKWTPSGATMGGRRIARAKAMGSPFGSRWTSGATAWQRFFGGSFNKKYEARCRRKSGQAPFLQRGKPESRAARRCVAEWA
jgi:hypothetical protein